jgi:hypothetical protein
MSSGTFVTAVDAGGAAASPKASSPARSSGGSPQHSMVRRIEDEEFVFCAGSDPQSLPPVVNFKMVADDLLDTVIDPEDGQSQRVWSTHIPSADFNAIVSDLYWYCFLHIFRKATGRKLSRPTKEEAAVHARSESDKQNLLDRISARYGSLFYTVVVSTPLLAQQTNNHNSNNSTSDGDMLFQSLSNAIAQAVYLAMFHAYPRSRRQVNTAAVRDELVDVCGLRLDGVRPSLTKHDHWLNSLDQQAARKTNPLGADGMMSKSKGKAKKSTDTSFVRTQRGPSMPIKPRVRLQKRRTRLGHTPMLERYLPQDVRWEINIGLMQDSKSRPLTEIEPKHHVRDETKAHSTAEDNDREPTAEELYQEEQEQMLQQTMQNQPSKTYQDVVTETRRHAKSLLREHKQKYAALNSDLNSARKQVRKEQKSIDEQCREIQGKDAHEFSNYIVSRMDLQGARRK